MNKLFKFFAILVAVLLSACGGGGGFSGTPTGPSATLRVFPMVDSISLPVGAGGSTGIEVQGGQKPYVVISSDASVSASISDDNILLISGNSAGTSTLSIQDQNRQQVQITVTATVVALASTVGTSVNMLPSQSRSFTVRGGVAPYVVSSTNPAVATVTASGSNGSYTITSGATTGTTTIHVLDGANTELDISVTVAANPLVVNPTTVSGVAGGSGSLQITGGLAPYSVTSSNTSVVSASGTSYSLVGAGTATLSISDAAGQTASVSVTVTAAAQSLTVAPTTQSVADDSTATSAIYQIAGGTAPYSVVASPGDASFIIASVDNTAKALTIARFGAKYCSSPAAARVVQVTVYDAKLASQVVTLNVTHAATSTCP